MAADRIIRIANSGGYWGDDHRAFYRQLSFGRPDYISMDFLAEITMSILQKQRSRNNKLGYATDFLDQVRTSLPLLAGSATRVISNAGGINPMGCAEAVEALAHEAGQKLRIAVVQGDDLMGRLDELLDQDIKLSNMETGSSLSDIRDRVLSANVYLGAAPVIEALRGGAEIIITGRVTDTGISVAPPAFEFEWDSEDWDRLASAVIAGHVIECGAQASGGNLTDWQEVDSFQRMGYPIVEFSADGSFVVTKAEKTGGLVNRKTVCEQLVYEMGDPARYVTPDVIADFTSIGLEEVAKNRVRISGARGFARPDTLKVSVSYHGGYKAHGMLIVSRPDAVAKCRKISELFWKRLGVEFEETSTELVGYNATHRHLIGPFDPPEILLRLGVRDKNDEKVTEFAREFTALILSSVSGVAIVGARPRVQDVVAYWPCLIPAQEVTPNVSFLETRQNVQIPWQPARTGTGKRETGISGREPQSDIVAGIDASESSRTVRLEHLCYGRSGDKGDTANIGVVARSAEVYAWLVGFLTAERVKNYFGDLCRGEVERFEVPNLRALNFLLHESLGGGGTVSLRIDPQGKTLAQALLMMTVEVPVSLIPPEKAVGGSARTGS